MSLHVDSVLVIPCRAWKDGLGASPGCGRACDTRESSYENYRKDERTGITVDLFVTEIHCSWRR